MGVYPKGQTFGSPAFVELGEFLEEADLHPEAVAGSLEDFEGKLHDLFGRCEAEAVGRYLEHYDVSAEEMEVGGLRYRRKMRCEQPYTCQAGTVRVDRHLYVPAQGEGKAICPMEVRAGIVEGCWTPRAAKLMLRAVASTTPQEAEDLFEEFGGMRPSRSSLDRLPKKASEVWEARRDEFERELRQTEVVPAEAVAVAVSLDGVQTPMKDAGRVETRSQADKRPQGPAGYREVGCGTISFYDIYGDREGTTRYARMPEKKKVTLKAELEAELFSIFRTCPGLAVALISDGAPDHREFLKALAEKLGIEDVYLVLDIFHALERIKKALDAYHGEQTPESRAKFEECRIWLREEEDGVERVLRALRYRRDKSRGWKKRTIEAEIRYIEKRKDLMRYADLQEKNLPIGSGVMEAACKTLVTERMKRSGMSWGEDGGQAILTLRSLIQSKRWERGWRLLAQQYKGEVTMVAKITPVPNRLKATG
jgi:hypothetical protein